MSPRCVQPFGTRRHEAVCLTHYGRFHDGPFCDRAISDHAYPVRPQAQTFDAAMRWCIRELEASRVRIENALEDMPDA